MASSIHPCGVCVVSCLFCGVVRDGHVSERATRLVIMSAFLSSSQVVLGGHSLFASTTTTTTSTTTSLIMAARNSALRTISGVHNPARSVELAVCRPAWQVAASSRNLSTFRPTAKDDAEPLYDGHVRLSSFQKAFMTAGAALASLHNPARGGGYTFPVPVCPGTNRTCGSSLTHPSLPTQT